MKLLTDVLVDYDIAQLQSLAYKRGLTPPKNHNREALKRFVEDLLSPASIAIIINDLNDGEQAALQHLIANGGFLETPTFTRLYGSIRPMGSNKLLREKPWESPENATEGLWYRGLIFKGFHHTPSGPEEIIFIPDDLQAVLPIEPIDITPFKISVAPIPAHIYTATPLWAREDLFNMLVYIQINILRLDQNDDIPPKHQQALQKLVMLSTQIPFEEADPKKQADYTQYWAKFIIHLAHRLHFLRKQGQRLKLNTQTVKTWLQRNMWQQIIQLQGAWRNDPTWNDLWNIPTLHPKATGWENSPMLGRSKILSYLAKLPTDEWISLNTFCNTLKRTEPDFQRPNGDYQTWYIYNNDGNPLMGFEHWDQVEGRLIKHLLTTVLYGLGVVDLGAPAENLTPTTFKITPLGQAFLFPEKKPNLPTPPNPTPLRINPAEFIVHIPHTTTLYDRFQLARFATFIQWEKKRVIYQISRHSYLKALEQSIHLEQILAFLNRATQAKTPLTLVEAMRNWDRRTASVKLERLTVLRVNQDDMLSELLTHPTIGPLLDVPLGSQAILVPEKNLTQLRKLLITEGYLEI